MRVAALRVSCRFQDERPRNPPPRRQTLSAVAATERHVYFGVERSETELMRVSVDGGEPTMVVSNAQKPCRLGCALRVDDTHLYYPSNDELRRVDFTELRGETVIDAVQLSYNDAPLALTGEHVHWVTERALFRGTK